MAAKKLLALGAGQFSPGQEFAVDRIGHIFEHQRVRSGKDG
jgi:hypothetical protein